MSDRPYDPQGGPPGGPYNQGYGPSGPGQPDPNAQGFPPQGQPQQGAPGSYGSAPGSYPSAGQPDQGGYPASTGSPGYPPASSGSPSYPPTTGSPGYPPAGPGSPSYPPSAGGPGYPDQGYGAQPYQTQAGYAGGGGGYGSPPPPQKSGGGKGKLFAIIGGALALLVIVGVVLALTVFKPGGETAGDDPTETTKPQSASDAVKGYLEALAAGDAEKALTFAQTQPTETTFLTNEFLKAAVEKAAITDINVPEGSGTSSSYERVTATYRIGPKAVTQEYTANKIGDEWKLAQVAATGQKPTNWGSLPVTINGTALTGDVITLFPGLYTVGLDNKFVGFDNPQLAVDGPTTSVRAYNMTPALNATGKQTIITQARQLLARCLTIRQMAPAGCGFAVRMPAGVTPVTSTIRWSRTTTQDPFVSVTPRLDYNDPGVATMFVSIPVKVTVTGSDGRPYVGNSSITRSIATIKPDSMQVMFQR